jgi:very-short-patch-repair endonuclease
MIAQPKGGEPDSDFEIEVAERLRRKDFPVDTQIGVSGYKIDLGVRHPDYPGRFLAGIECDGATYHRSKSARDRDRLREEVLRSLGWDIIRVWSTDWFDNPDAQTDKLVKLLNELRARPIASFRDYGFKAAYASGLAVAGTPEPTLDNVSSVEQHHGDPAVSTASLPPRADPEAVDSGAMNDE